MCGIVGLVKYRGIVERDVIEKMSNAILHRGPDDVGILTIDNVGFGHRRLSIIDLSSRGHQPMVCGQFTIVYNGEIYNFAQIRHELEAVGYVFDSSSDTEVVLKAFDKWGMECLQKFVGMFAFAIYDSKNKKIYLARDRAGVKPLYFYRDENCFSFVSELKSLHGCYLFKPKLSRLALNLYLKFGYVPAPLSIFENTYKLKPGYWISVDVYSGDIEEHRYWNIEDSYLTDKLDISYSDAKKELTGLMSSVFLDRMVSDVPVGVFLSGGYDSTAVAAIIQASEKERLNTFTIGFKEESFDESGYARAVAEYLGANHDEFICSYMDAQKLIPELPEIYDEPFGDSSALPTVMVSRLAKKHVKVVLSADAGDELFFGYKKYIRMISNWQVVSQIPSMARQLLSGALQFGAPIAEYLKVHNGGTRCFKLSEMLKADDFNSFFKISNYFFSDNEIKSLLLDDCSNGNSVFDSLVIFNDITDAMLCLDYKTYLADDILVKVDKATMSASIEGREPFLDHRLAEYVARLPQEYKYSDGKTKRILKDIVHDFVPPKLMDREKMGFGIPVEKWMLSELKWLLDEHMSEEIIKKDGIFDYRKIEEIKNKFLTGRLEYGERVWFLLCFQMWYGRWMRK